MKEQKRKKAKLFNLKMFPLDIAKILCTPTLLFFRIKKIYTSDTAKKKLRGGMLIAANHTCIMDPLILCACFWYRRIFYLTAEAVMDRKKLRGFLLKKLGCVRINRDICDIESIRSATDVVKNGHVLALFPQGGIKEDNIESIKSGIILLAMQSRVPIVPCYIHNKSGFGDRNCVVIGDPIDIFENGTFPAMKEINNLAQTVMEKMTECKAIYEESKEKRK
ncbi:MAG: 1-acyl-sn-glycerol-3-phosphate acyltransferase [Clostridia bacterium]|nr:1-acyl-sn-glycerol-3-phosphate acyltransferase [Clostridia bacterium]